MLWFTYIAIYLYEVGGNPTPCDQCQCATVIRNTKELVKLFMLFDIISKRCSPPRRGTNFGLSSKDWGLGYTGLGTYVSHTENEKKKNR